MPRNERERRKHKPLTAAGLKKREDQQGGMFDSLCKDEFKTFRPKPGLNVVRFFEGTWPDASHWAHDTWIHNQIGPDNGRYLCLNKMLGKDCPLCDERRALQAAGETEAAKAIAARKGACGWVINRADEEAGPLLWFYGRTVDEEFSTRCRSRKTGDVIDIIDPDEGNDVSFKVTKEGNVATNVKYSAYEIDRDQTPIHEKQNVQDRWLDFVEENPVPDCFKFYDAEYLKKLITGSHVSKARDAEEDAEDEEDEKPRGKRRSLDDEDEDEAPRSRRRSRDDDDDEPPKRRGRRDDDEDEDEEEEEPPPRRRRASRDEDEEEDEKPARRRVRDDDEEDDPPKRRARPSRDAADDEEDEEEAPSRRAKSRRPTKDVDEDEDEPAPRKRPRSRLEDDLDDEIPSKRRGSTSDKPAARRMSKSLRISTGDEDDIVEQGKRALKNLKNDDDDDDEEKPRRRTTRNSR